MGEGEDRDIEERFDAPADDAESRPDGSGSLYPLGFVACFFGFFAVFLGGLGYILYRVATTEESIPSGWYWAVAVGSSMLGAPLFLLDEKNPRKVQRFGRYLAQVVGVAAIVAAVVAVWLLLTDGLRMLSGLEWAGILVVALVVNVLETLSRKRNTSPTT